MSDEFSGTSQDLQSFWQVKDGDKSPWELKDGLLVAEAGFDQNLWGADTSTRFYQVTDMDQFDIETSMVVDYADACTVAGICEGEGAGKMTVTFDYFREASSPATPVDPRDRLAVTWGELKGQE